MATVLGTFFFWNHSLWGYGQDSLEANQGANLSMFDSYVNFHSLGGGFKCFLFHPENWGNILQFDGCIFFGWNHQLP